MDTRACFFWLLIFFFTRVHRSFKEKHFLISSLQKFFFEVKFVESVSPVFKGGYPVFVLHHTSFFALLPAILAFRPIPLGLCPSSYPLKAALLPLSVIPVLRITPQVYFFDHVFLAVFMDLGTVGFPL